MILVVHLDMDLGLATSPHRFHSRQHRNQATRGEKWLKTERSLADWPEASHLSGFQSEAGVGECGKDSQSEGIGRVKTFCYQLEGIKGIPFAATPTCSSSTTNLKANKRHIKASTK